jgi:guanidinopropionase
VGEPLRPIDSTEVARYVEVATFLRAPRVDDLDAVDVGIVGIPHDLGASWRPGARYAPGALREATRAVRGYNPALRIEPFALARVADLGDVRVDPYDHAVSLERIGEFAQHASERGVRLLGIGGDHSVTWPLLRGMRRHAPVALVQFDAHPDFSDVVFGSRLSNATPVRRAIEEGLVDPERTVQIGLRGSTFRADDHDWGHEAGIRMLTMDEIDGLGRAGLVAEVLRVVGDAPVYVTVDIDGLDPSEAPGTGVAEPGGVLFRDARAILLALAGHDLVGADVVEVAPNYDPTGVTLATAGALMFELVCLLAAAHDRAR